MKRLLGFLLCFSILAATAGCGNGSKEEPSDHLMIKEETATTIVSGEPETDTTHTHSYKREVADPTCISDGYDRDICSCGHISYEQIFKKSSYHHVWVEATCTSPFICSLCGATEGIVTGHSWKSATCKAAKTCYDCGATEGGLGEHNWKAATCSAPKTCRVCNTTEGALAEHDWKAATCSAPKTCRVCNTTEGALAEHDWKAATCTKPKTCRSCGNKDGEPLPHIWRDATYTKPKTCTSCNLTDGDALPEPRLYLYGPPNQVRYNGRVFEIHTRKAEFSIGADGIPRITITITLSNEGKSPGELSLYLLIYDLSEHRYIEDRTITSRIIEDDSGDAMTATFSLSNYRSHAYEIFLEKIPQ